jgi:uncharacterized membrane protein YeaQ/YmgE (transglycosylase-associated protein family)
MEPVRGQGVGTAMRRPNPTEAVLFAGVPILLLLLYVFGVSAVVQGLIWVAVGGVVGWIGSVILCTETQQGIMLDIASGALGALAGLLLLGAPVSGGGPLETFLASVVGSVIVIAAAALVRGWRPWRKRAETGNETA